MREARAMPREAMTRSGYRPAAVVGALTILAGTILTGCGGGEVRHLISGTVNYDGKPVEMGTISFDSGNPDLMPDGAAIVDGRYECEVRPGKMTVRITASRKRPPVPGDPDVFYEDYIPARHNTNSTLTVEITGTDTMDFNLTAL